MNEKISFATQIRERRELLGWSQSKLADEAGVTREYIGKLEKGASTPPSTAKGLSAVMKALGLHINDPRVVYAEFLADVERKAYPVARLVEQGYALLELMRDQGFRDYERARVNLSQARLYREIFIESGTRSDAARVVEHAQTAYGLYISSGDQYSACQALYVLGILDFETGRHEEGRAHLMVASRHLDVLGFDATNDLYCKVELGLALIACRIGGDVSTHLEYCERHVDKASAALAPFMGATIDYLRAKKLSNAGNAHGAVEAYQQAEAKYRDLNDAANAARMSFNVAECYVEIGEYEKAELRLWEIHERAVGDDVCRNEAMVHLVKIAAVCVEDAEKAELCASKVLESPAATNAQKAHALLYLAYAFTGNDEKSIPLLKMGIELARNENDAELTRKLVEELLDTYHITK